MKSTGSDEKFENIVSSNYTFSI